MGPQGPQGPQGNTGPIGLTGLTGNNGVNGTLAYVSNTAPLPSDVGQIWLDTDDSTLSVFYSNTWIVTSGPIGPQGPQGLQGDPGFYASTSETSPFVTDNGFMWFNTTDTTLNVRYANTWITTSGPKGDPGFYASTSNTTPEATANGYMWFNTEDATLNVRYANTWITTSGPAGPEGPPGKTIADVSPVATGRTLTISDRDVMILSGSNTATTFTIPTDAAVNFPISSTVHFSQDGAGQVTVAGDVGVTVNIRNGLTNKTAVRYAMCTALKVASNRWYLFGDLE